MSMFEGRQRVLTRMTSNEIDDAVLTMTEKEAAKVEWPLNRKWLRVFWWFIAVVFMLLGGRIFYLNVVQGGYYQDMAKRNSVRSIVTPAPRGGIMDRFGKVLVNNVPSVDLVAVPADFPQEDDARQSEIAALQNLFHLTDDARDEMILKIKEKLYAMK